MSLFEKHNEILDRAVKAIRERSFYAAYPDNPKAFSEDAPAQGLETFQGLLNKNFDLEAQRSPLHWLGEEVSPYTNEPLGVLYPVYSVEDLVSNSKIAFHTWRKISPSERAGLLVESLERMKAHFFDIASATQHTTGQSWIMSFQASGPHAADRALEAIAMGYAELTRFPEKVMWEKPMGKSSVRLEKTLQPVPKGISLVIGCSTFPVWNSLPGIYASLVTGNSVIVKPHPRSVLPIAICVSLLQQTLAANGYDPSIVQLAADTSSSQNTKEIASHPYITLIDYTGSSSFGNYIESLPGKTTFTEKAGINAVIIDSVKDLDAALQNLAFSVSLYSGQMCTAPQNFFIPETVRAGDQVLSFDVVAAKLKEAISGLVSNPKMGSGVLGAIQNEETLERAQHTGSRGKKIWLEPMAVKNDEFLNARTISPLLMEADSADAQLFENELFGPVSIVIKTKNTVEALRLAKELAAEHGAITCAAYTTNDSVMKMICDEMNEVFVPVTFNLTGPYWVNQHAAFSDFHVTGGNPAGNASLVNPEFVIKRFVWVGNRNMIA
ncbi:MAG: phenylacetic acid degradation protein PaaN [Chitinophagales bacterium]|nr:phenylacetic acid degradation protein PaaN [Chitinophagales bacterium]